MHPLTTWIFTALIGCTSGGTDTDDKAATDDTVVDTDTGGDTDESQPEGPLILTGDLVDASGAAVTTGVRVQYCRGDACRTANTFKDGTYSFYALDAGPGSFEIVNLDDASGRISLFAPIVVDAETRTLDVVIPTASPKATLPATATWLSVGDGLEIELASGQLTPASPFDPAVTAVWGAAASTMLPSDGLTGTITAMHYLAPFDAEADPGFAFRFADPGGIADGAASVWYADYATASWTEIGDLVSDGDGHLVVTGGLLPKLTTIAIRTN